MKKVRNPQDATLRNILALKKRVGILEDEMKALRMVVVENSAVVLIPRKRQKRRSR